MKTPLASRMRMAGVWMLGVLLASSALADDRIIRLATTTSTYSSGLLDVLLPIFEADHPYRVQVIPVGTGKALRMGRDGDVDLVMTHAPAAGKAFVNADYGIEPHGVMYNDFVIVGPENDPADVRDSTDAARALADIAASDVLFVSRGDNSGTYTKELSLWQAAGLEPDFEGYRAAGQGMGRVLQIASELQGYTLTDRGTWLAMQDKLELILLVEGDKRLNNPYQVILVNPKRYEGLNTQGARALAEWLVSCEGQQAIQGFHLNGQTLFHANAGAD